MNTIENTMSFKVTLWGFKVVRALVTGAVIGTLIVVVGAFLNA